MTKIFIYDFMGVSNLSRDDLAELFTTAKIVDNPEIQLTNFSENFDKLPASSAVIVFPGGNAMCMADSIIAGKVSKLVANGAAYVGICAGAFIAPESCHIFKTTYEQEKGSNFFVNPIHVHTLDQHWGSFSLMKDYYSYCSFYPNEQYINYPELAQLPRTGYQKKVLKPYSVKLSFSSNTKPLHALYVEGPCFVPNKNATPEVDVIATYADKSEYTFFHNNINEKHANLPAILSRKRQESGVGPLFISGVHLEASLPNSKFLQSFKQEHHDLIKLSDNNIQALENDVASLHENITSLLKITLKR